MLMGLALGVGYLEGDRDISRENCLRKPGHKSAGVATGINLQKEVIPGFQGEAPGSESTDVAVKERLDPPLYAPTCQAIPKTAGKETF
jgi:hypothetical protein